MISEAILIPKIYARLQEIAFNFTKFSGKAPAGARAFAARFGASPRYRLLLSKIPGSALDSITITPSRDWWVAGNTVRYLTTRAILQRFCDEVAMSRVRILPCHFLR